MKQVLEKWNIEAKKKPKIGQKVLGLSARQIDYKKDIWEEEYAIREVFYLENDGWLTCFSFYENNEKGIPEMKMLSLPVKVKRWHPFGGLDLMWWVSLIYNTTGFYWSNKEHIAQLSHIGMSVLNGTSR